MNKRAQARLIGVTAIILIAVGALIFGTGKTDGAYSKSVKEIVEDKSLVGERVKVSGTVVPGSWNKRSNPMEFDVREEKVTDGPTLRIVYNGRVPETFGDNVTAIVTGDLTEAGQVEATTMTVKCPSKYESETGAMSVADLVKSGSAMTGKAARITGVVTGGVNAPGTDERFRIRDVEGTDEVAVVYEGGLPAAVKDGATVVIGGSLDASGAFDATSVSLSKEKK